ncbi:PREDICTED: neuropeptide Y receptor type 2-like [Priapulus caudatus]|uniref:Neuropeptide Y receptor type 2-like n=1 Tax=Priapulus caudatus TaxID=37621 RepID=A0ABM1EWR9_PRICU|nr:PREDICTED: neuropeptide Y receptor type 2-like [Priapulus caudatus]
MSSRSHGLLMSHQVRYSRCNGDADADDDDVTVMIIDTHAPMDQSEQTYDVVDAMVADQSESGFQWADDWPMPNSSVGNDSDLWQTWLADYETRLRQEIQGSLYTHRTALTVGLVVAYGVVFLIGLVGNILVFLTVARYRSMRTLTYTFLVNLAVGDIMVVVVCMPLTLGYTVYRAWLYGDVMCRLMPFVQGVSVSVSVLTLLVVSVDRYYKIYHPVKARVIFHSRHVRAIVAVVWIVSTLLMLPFLFVSRTLTDDVGVTICTEHWSHVAFKRSHGMFLFAVLYVVPVCIMTYAYAKIARTLWHGDKRLRKTDTQRQQFDALRIQNRRRKLVKLIIMLTILFAITWLPYHVVILWLDFSHVSDALDDSKVFVGTRIYPIVQWLALTNSSVNPICYCLFSQKFRSAVRMLCGCGGVDSERVLYNSEATADATNSSFLRRSWRALSQHVRRQGGRPPTMRDVRTFQTRRHCLAVVARADGGGSNSLNTYVDMSARRDQKWAVRNIRRNEHDMFRRVSSPV